MQLFHTQTTYLSLFLRLSCKKLNRFGGKVMAVIRSITALGKQVHWTRHAIYYQNHIPNNERWDEKPKMQNIFA